MRCASGRPRAQILALIRALAAFLMLICPALIRAAQALSPCPPSPPQELRLPALRSALATRERIIIVAFGSSSTAGAGASTPEFAYPAQLERLLRAAWPGRTISVLNKGRGGQTTAAMMVRLEDDVLAHRPTMVIWQHGANAAMRQLDPAQFEMLTRLGMETIAALGIDLVFMDNQRAPRILSKPGHELYGEVLARWAIGPRTSLFSRTALMLHWEQVEPSGLPMIGDDEVHHTDRGYTCLAEALARSIITAVGDAGWR